MAYSKYSAKPTHVDGIRFASKAEAKRFGELKTLERLGIISGLKLQPMFAIEINGKHCFKYYGDFEYQENGIRVIEDVKSKATATDYYRLKKRCVEAAYGITITEIGIQHGRKPDAKSREIQEVFREATRRRA